MKRHLVHVTRRPSRAQLEPAIELIGLLSAIIALLSQASSVFGFQLPKKGNDSA